LPVYINAVHTLRVYGASSFDQDLQSGQPSYWLQEDGDPSHGKRKEGLAQRLKAKNWISNLYHPAEAYVGEYGSHLMS
jgi:hypothetical protein